MPRSVALLRAVNLGGGTSLRMEALRATLDASGFGPAGTVLQSGNVVLSPRVRATASTEERLERLLASSFRLRTDVFVRSAEEWHRIVGENPHPDAARDDPSHLTVLVARSAAPEARWTELARQIPGRETVRAAGRNAYVVYPDGIGRSWLTLDRIERTLGVRGTLRNWNTVLKVDALLGPT